MAFPKFLSLSLYVSMGAAFTLLTKASQADGEYSYRPLAVVLMVECTKFVIATCISFYQSDRRAVDHFRFLSQQWHVAKWFGVVAGGYFFYNVLQYINLGLVSGPTYRIIISTKVMWSGWLLQIFMGTPLSGKQWLALVMLIFGCGLEQLGSFDLDTGVLALILLSIQAFCSSAAGVANQYLLKNRDIGGLGLWEKNIFMYAWGIVFTCLFIYHWEPDLVAHPYQLIEMFEKEPLMIWIVLTNSCMGFATSLLLRDMNVLYKEYANFAEMLVLVFGTWICFGTAPKFIILPATMVVSISLYMYNTEGARLDELRAQQPTQQPVPLIAVAVTDPRQD